MSASSQLGYFVRTAVGSMVRSPFVHVIAVASLALALVGFGVARLAGQQLEALVNSMGSEVEFTVYLVPDAPPEKVEELKVALVKRTGGSAVVVSPAEALGRLAKQLGDQGRGLTDLGENPLPWSVELKLPPAARETAILAALAQETRKLSIVADVDYGAEALERLTLIARALRLAGLIAFVLVGLTTVVIVSATLQLAIFARREEIEIQKLVGGTDRFVRMPFLIEGALQGLLAAGISLAALFALVHFLESERAEVVAFLRLGGRVAVQWPRLAMEEVGLGVALGLLGSFIAVRRFLKV